MAITLVSKKVVVNQETFAPELEVVVRLAIEPLQDSKALDPKFYENFGKEFSSVLVS